MNNDEYRLFPHDGCNYTVIAHGCGWDGLLMQCAPARFPWFCQLNKKTWSQTRNYFLWIGEGTFVLNSKKRFGFLPTCYSISRRLSILDPYYCFERLWFHVPSYSTKCLSQDCWVIFGTPKAPMSRPIRVWLKNMMQGEAPVPSTEVHGFSSSSQRPSLLIEAHRF